MDFALRWLSPSEAGAMMLLLLLYPIQLVWQGNVLVLNICDSITITDKSLLTVTL